MFTICDRKPYIVRLSQILKKVNQTLKTHSIHSVSCLINKALIAYVILFSVKFKV